MKVGLTTGYLRMTIVLAAAIPLASGLGWVRGA
jgi:hypothetical protein